MNVYYLVGMLGMFGLGYRVGVAFERIRRNVADARRMHGLRLIFVQDEEMGNGEQQ